MIALTPPSFHPPLRFGQVMGYMNTPTWRSTLESLDDSPVQKVKSLLRNLRLVNTVTGPELIIIGDETLHQLVMWPEEKNQFRKEGRSAVVIQKRLRGMGGRKKSKHRRLYRHLEEEGRRKLNDLAMENKKRSSAAVLLQASVKRGLAHKRKDLIRSVLIEKEDEKRREIVKLEFLNLRARECQRIVRGWVGRRRAVKRRLEVRAGGMERRRLYEATVVLEGTPLVLVGKLIWEGRREEEGEDYRSAEVPVECYSFRVTARDKKEGKESTIHLTAEMVGYCRGRMEVGSERR